ncbi:MAG: Type II secretion system protein E [Parcubacteria group bacterium GW2011_GWA2_47_10]|nr:MAG: Type II secretion system protein E [Parcubacteria group bacterium GW2011_GWA2_47_10]
MAQAEPPKNEITIEEFFDTVLTQAITERTSDIHIEPLVKEMSIRFRIDGILQEKGLWPLYDLEPLTTRIKALSNLDITTHVGPQDGHFEFLYKPNLQAAHEEETLRGKEGRSDPLSRFHFSDRQRRSCGSSAFEPRRNAYFTERSRT